MVFSTGLRTRAVFLKAEIHTYSDGSKSRCTSHLKVCHKPGRSSNTTPDPKVLHNLCTWKSSSETLSHNTVLCYFPQASGSSPRARQMPNREKSCPTLSAHEPKARRSAQTLQYLQFMFYITDFFLKITSLLCSCSCCPLVAALMKTGPTSTNSRLITNMVLEV